MFDMWLTWHNFIIESVCHYNYYTFVSFLISPHYRPSNNIIFLSGLIKLNTNGVLFSITLYSSINGQSNSIASTAKPLLNDFLQKFDWINYNLNPAFEASCISFIIINTKVPLLNSLGILLIPKIVLNNLVTITKSASNTSKLQHGYHQVQEPHSFIFLKASLI